MLLNRLQMPSMRLLTLRGTGGVGKTRLALEVAHKAWQYFPDGVFFVSLGTIRDVTLVPSTIIQALHLSEPLAEGDLGRQNIISHKAMLKEFLRDKGVLLVLDNVEQIPEMASFVSNMLSIISRLKILVTSRTVLHLYGEHEFDVPPLEVYSPNTPSTLENILQCPAIRLFIERAQAVNASFRITEQNAATIAHICTRLDGLPLAIELAAVRTKVLPVSKILQRLAEGTGQSLTFLRTMTQNALQKHQTLYETLDWSYELLDQQQQKLFRRLSIFLGGWTLEAAQAVAMIEDQEATSDEILEQMEALINHSLVKPILAEEQFPEEIVEPRFHFLETIREYGLGRLEASGERKEIQHLHAIYYLKIAEELGPSLSNRTQERVLPVLAQEQDNLRAALAWGIEQNEAEIVQRLCGTLGKYWEARTQFQEAHRWIDVAIKMTEETAPAIRAKLLLSASRLALWETSCESSREFAQKALVLFEEIGDSQGKTQAIFQIGDTWHMQGEYTQANKYLEESLHLQYEQKDWASYAFTLSRLGAVAILQSNYVQAWTWLNEALPLMRKYSESALLNVTLIYLGVLALIQGEITASLSYLREGLLLAQQTGNRYMVATDLIAFGCLLGIIRGASYTARVCSAAEILFENLNTSLPAAYRPLYDAFVAGIKSQVDEITWSAWWATGQTLSQQEVITLVLTTTEEKD